MDAVHWMQRERAAMVDVSTRCEPCFAISFLQHSSKQDNYYVDRPFFCSN